MKWHRKVLNSIPGLKKKSDKPGPKAQPAPALLAAKPQLQATHPPGSPARAGVARDGVESVAPPPIEISQPATKPQKMLEDVCAFLARYLQCSEHQRIVLALWVLHTWCFSAAKASPYLAIQSSQKLSGKTLCLRLLSVLCSKPALTSGYTPSALVKRIHSHPAQLPTFLLDESPATVGSRSRSKNPRLRAILVSGFQPGIGYSDSSAECTIFSPKAFASTGPLPEALADCSLPIILKPLGPQPPSAASGDLERFDLSQAHEEAKSIVAALQHWSRKNIAALKSLRPLKRKDFPARFTPRGQDMVEPLFHLADAIGGDYSARARQALLAVFDDVEKQQRDIATQLLRDIRNIFQRYDWPDGLPTAVLVSELQSLPARPWDADGRITDRTLPRMLRPFEIYPHMIRFKESGDKGSGKTLRGYSQKEFVTLWHNLLDQAEISNKDAGCYAVTHAGTSATKPESGPQEIKQTGPQPPSAASSEKNRVAQSDAAGLRAASAATEPKKSQSEGRLAGGLERSDTNKDAGCYTVTHAGTSATKPESGPQEIKQTGPQPPSAASSEKNRVAQSDAAGLRAASAATEPKKSQSEGRLAGGLERGTNSANSDAAGLRAASAATEPKKSQSEGRLAGGLERSDTKKDPRIVGILADPRNYFRQYPDQSKNNLRDIAVKSNHWPQPADDKGPADVIYTLDDGIAIPYTLVNRDPWNPKGVPSYHNKRERWPVLLNDEEKTQVATARFFEIHAAASAQRAQKKDSVAQDREEVSAAVS